MEVTELDKKNESMITNRVNYGSEQDKSMGLNHQHDFQTRIRTIDFKFFISELALNHNYENLSNAFAVKLEEIREWRKQSDLLRQAYNEKYDMSYNTRTMQPEPVCSELEPGQIKRVSSTPSGKNGKKSSYNTEFKLKAVDFAEKSTNRAAAKHFNVNDKRIREWRKNKDILLTSPKDRRRLRGAGRRPLIDNGLEQLLFDWISLSTKDGNAVTVEELQEKAIELSLAALPQGSKFSASKAWIERFLKRYNLITGDNAIGLDSSFAETVEAEGNVAPTMVIEDLPGPVTSDSTSENNAYLTQ